MSLEGKSDAKLFFVSDEPVSFSNYLMLTAVVKDASDAVTGVKRFKVVGR